MDIVFALIAFIAAVVALLQYLASQRAIRVQRVIDLHKDLTTGEVGAARDRFTTLMWKHGEKLAGRNQCHAPSWDEILPDVLGGGSRGLLGRYRAEDEIAGFEDAEPMRDLYAVLWCFERVEAAREGRALDGRMLSKLLARHAVWWNVLTRQLTPSDTIHLASLRSLAANVSTPAIQEWADKDFALRDSSTTCTEGRP
jgi:hypothetical protein